MKTAPLLNCKLVVESADGSIDPDGEKILSKKEIDVIPDILCNSSAIIVNYFEWIQNKKNEFWDTEKVCEKLKRKIINAYNNVKKTAMKFKCNWRTGAYIIALKRLEMVYKKKGIFP